jgi:hypothetical protein
VRCSALWPLVQVISIGAGGGAQTAGVSIEAKLTFTVRSPVSAMLAAPVSSGLSGPGDPEGLGVSVGVGDPASGGGGEMSGEGP